ncbi:DUF2937 family protein [Salinimonas chungwhensis]|uniref:DUF2937 family protein n=1 Tax=Salinimonas chungwhensis TaxID=265425 RepID=UPI000382E661|nr:DUF2937 family protein [Salinimonas chungwhensis]
MKVLVNVIDKIIFAAVFILALQVPILADHYRQYLAGYHDATAQSVKAYRQLAQQYGYDNVDAMIDELQNNQEPVVREDAANKARQLQDLISLKQGIETLSQGNYFTQAWYMFTPSRFATLRRVADNFSPSVPLAPAAVLFSLITAIVINLLFWTPALCVRGVRKLRKKPIRFAR